MKQHAADEAMSAHQSLQVVILLHFRLLLLSQGQMGPIEMEEYFPMDLSLFLHNCLLLHDVMANSSKGVELSLRNIEGHCHASLLQDALFFVT